MTITDPNHTGPSPLKRWRGPLWGLAMAAALGMAWYEGQTGSTRPAAALPAGPGGAFALTASDGTTFTERNLAGRPFAIYFGFTRCPEVCPTSLAKLARLRAKLGSDGARLAIVFVSVDPGHDKPADIGRYVTLFGTPIIGLTGSETQLAQITKAYGVYVAKVPQPGGDYTIDHTAATYLMDANGQFSNLITHDDTDEAALVKLRQLVS